MNKKIISIFIIVFLILCANSAVFAHDNMNKNSKLEVSNIDDFMSYELKRLNIPGASLAIIKGDKVEYLKGYGISNPDGTKMTSKTPIVLGSVSKSFTALAIMQLVEQGKIRLHEPVYTYIPWFQLADKEESKKITVQHLLNHTSGLSTYDGQVSISQGNQTIKQHVRTLANVELSDYVGERYQYSNLNYNILGAVIEEVTNQSYGEYMNESIFKPLEMKNTYTNPKEDVNNKVAVGYQTIFGFKKPTNQLNHEGTVSSGYIISNAEDMANYMIFQLNHGKYKQQRILSTNAVNIMHKASSLIDNDIYYAMGWDVNDDVISHNGWTENTYTKVTLDGEYGISLLINSMDCFYLFLIFLYR